LSLADAFMCLTKLVIVCVIGKYLAGSIPFLAVVVFVVQSFYLRTSRQMRLLDIEAKAPLYTHFLETIQGVSTIRAFNWGRQFCEQNHKLLDDSQKPVYVLFCMQQWLTNVLNLVVGVMAVILVGILTSFKEKFSAASAGVALNVVLTFNENLATTIKFWTMMEISIGAVSRIQQFVQNTPSEIEDIPIQHSLEEKWPSSGTIQFENVTASYGCVLFA
jgi:ATP-binding cassette subfamily C (CFTR/MRP) protein 1